jgi:hypothetical protein
MASFKIETLQRPVGDPWQTKQQKTSERGVDRKHPNAVFGIWTQTNCLEWSLSLPPAMMTCFFTFLKLFENSDVYWFLRLNSEKPPEFRPCSSVVMNNGNNMQSKKGPLGPRTNRMPIKESSNNPKRHKIMKHYFYWNAKSLEAWTALDVWRKATVHTLCHWMRDKACLSRATWAVAEGCGEPTLQPRGLIPIRRNQ